MKRPTWTGLHESKRVYHCDRGESIRKEHIATLDKMGFTDDWMRLNQKLLKPALHTRPGHASHDAGCELELRLWRAGLTAKFPHLEKPKIP